MIEFHGNTHLKNAKTFQAKLLWGVVICAAVAATTALSVVTIYRYVIHPTSVSTDFIYKGTAEIPEILLCSSQVFQTEKLMSANISEFSIYYLQKYFVSNGFANAGFEPLNQFVYDFDHEQIGKNLESVLQSSNFEDFVLNMGIDCSQFLLDCTIDGFKRFNCCEVAKPLAHNMFGKCFVFRNLSAIGYQTSPGSLGGLTILLQTKEDPSSSATITKTTIYFEAATNLVIPTGTHIPLLTAASNHVELSLTQINLLENREGGCETDSHVSTKLCNSLAWAEAVQSLCNCTDTGYKTHDQIELDAPRNVCTPWGYAKCSSEKRPECLYLTLIKQNCHKPNCFINEFRTILTTSEIRQDYGRKWRNETDQNIQYTRLFVYYQILGHRSFSEFHSMTFDSVLSAVGGNIGLFLGASIISVVQLGSTIMLGLKRILNRLTN